MGRGDPTDVEWERLRPFLPFSNGRCGRWRDHRQVINGILHRVRTGVQWRGLPERFGAWKTVHERHGLWSADGTWERLFQQIQGAAEAVGEIDWDISVDSTIIRAHQHAAGARTDPPPTPVAKGGRRGGKKIRVPKTGPGRPRKKPDGVAADKAYSNGPCRGYLRRWGLSIWLRERDRPDKT